ncbi:MAG: serine protease, peptidase S9 family protein, partial [Sphingobacteriales bacterium]
YIPGQTLTMSTAIPSFDGKKIAIGYSLQGAEVDVIKVMDVNSKKMLADSIYPSAGLMGWTFDNKSLLYMWIRSADNKDPLSRLSPKTKLHLLGSKQENDIDLFSNGSYPDLNIDPSVYPYAFISKDAPRYLFAGLGTVQPEIVSYYAPMQEPGAGKIPWKQLSTAADKLVRSFVVINSDVYAITHNNAKNYKLVSTNLAAPSWANATVIAAEKADQTLEYFSYSKDYLVIVHSDGINNHLSKYNLKTKVTTVVKLPNTGTIDVSCVDTKTNNCTVGITSWNSPYTEYNFDAATDVFTPGSLNKPANYPAAYKDLEVKEVLVKGHDGAMIPLSIIHKKGLKLDGSNTCLLDGYGAYGSSSTPYFSVLENALAVKGTVIAIPHIRGGSEKGEEWYKAG